MTRHQLSFVITVSLLFSLLSLLVACNDQPSESFTSGSMINQLDAPTTLLGKNRSVPDEIHDLPSFDLIYEGSSETLMAENNTTKQLMKEHNLQLTHSFDLDKNYKGIKLQALSPLVDPILIGKKLSLGKQVLMVEVSNSTSSPKEYM